MSFFLQDFIVPFCGNITLDGISFDGILKYTGLSSSVLTVSDTVELSLTFGLFTWEAVSFCFEQENKKVIPKGNLLVEKFHINDFHQGDLFLDVKGDNSYEKYKLNLFYRCS